MSTLLAHLVYLNLKLINPLSIGYVILVAHCYYG